MKPDCCSGQLQRLPVLHQGVSGAGHLRGEQVVLARRARLKVATLCRLGLNRPRPARERRRLHDHVCATPSILVLEGQQSMPCCRSENPLTGRRPGGRPRPRPGRPGCAGAPPPGSRAARAGRARTAGCGGRASAAGWSRRCAQSRPEEKRRPCSACAPTQQALCAPARVDVYLTTSRVATARTQAEQATY